MYNPFEYEYNWLAIIVMVVFSMGLGFVWYARAFLGNQWMQLVGLKEEDLKKGPNPGVWIAMIVGSFVESYLLAWLIAANGATTFMEGLLVGFFVWLGFVFVTYMGSYMFARRPTRLLFIDTGYNLVFLVIAGGILAVWQ